MNFGPCPYCDGYISTAIPERAPAYANPTCPHCNKKYWIRLSRVESLAYTTEAFEEEFEVNYETSIIKKKR